MQLESKIKAIVEAAIPLDMKCAVTRSEQMVRRAKLRLDIEELLRERPQVGPSQLKNVS